MSWCPWLLLLIDLLFRRRLIPFRGGLIRGHLAQGNLDKPTGLPALVAAESPCFNARLAGWGNRDFDDLHAAPPTLMVSLIDPLESVCSVAVRPFRRASSFAFSMA